MLKIKDNVDLKELEKFGFIPEIYCGDRAYEKKYTKGFYKEYIIIWWKDREIQVRYNGQILLETLYDLIKADMVEKVEV